jgi:RNA polymerase sigma factor (sigma-70 family)
MMAKAAASPILQLIRRVVEDREVRELPDRDLLERFHSQHNEAAFHTLLRRHGPMALNVCRGVLGDGADAEDAFQATFLVLAQKAGSIRKGASLGSWLHGVAYRTALKARAQSAVRRKHEARAPRRQCSEANELSWREVRQVQHDELGGMPERYREPLVICYLEGATQQRAAARLGLAERTLRERLERGRELLRLRLVRRGLGPAAILAVAAWPAAAVSAGIPAVLVDSTVKAATSVAGGATASVVSAKVAALS